MPQQEEHDVSKSITVKRFEGRPDDIEDQPSNNRQGPSEGPSSVSEPLPERRQRLDSDDQSTGSLPPPPNATEGKYNGGVAPALPTSSSAVSLFSMKQR